MVAGPSLGRASHPRWGLVPSHSLCSCIFCSAQHISVPKHPENHWEGKDFGTRPQLGALVARCLCSTAVCPPASGTESLQEDSPRPAAADARAKAKQHSELTALHLASALKEVINRNNHPGAAALLGAGQGWSWPADAGQGNGTPFSRGSNSKRSKKLWKRREKEVPGRALGASLHTRHREDFTEEIK